MPSDQLDALRVLARSWRAILLDATKMAGSLALLCLLPFVGGCGSLSGSSTPGASVGVSGGPDGPLPPHTLFTPELPQLAEEVADHCAGVRSDLGKGLAPLATDLYLSGVEPADGTEALIRGGCATVAEIVTEMIAQGGENALEPVFERAMMLTGSGAAATIEDAARRGLERRTAMLAAPSGTLRESLVHGMRYFPYGAERSRAENAVAMNTLFELAAPDYGVYTFVLLGRLGRLDEEGHRRYRELFRIIETYVSASPDGAAADASVHSFLIPVYAEHGDAALVEQLSSDLSQLMVQVLARDLRHRDRARLAARLESSAGPFLVASLEPRLVPNGPDSPRLVVDLSSIGVESLYAIVDAFDRPIVPAQQHRPESLMAIRSRLLDLVAAGHVASSATAGAQWVFWVGRDASRA